MSERDKSGRRRPLSPPAPRPVHSDEQLDEALEETFPASDPPAPAHPDVTGWDIDEEPAEKEKKRTRGAAGRA